MAHGEIKLNAFLWFDEKNVLIAEDNAVAQKLLRKQLEKIGFVVESAKNGEEAVEIWQRHTHNYFCISFFDHHTPKRDGVEANKRIRARGARANFDGENEDTDSHRRLPIIALTADVQAKARDVCVDAGMDGYLTKPLIPNDLVATLREFCRPGSSTSSPLSPPTHTHFDFPFPLTPSSSYSS